MEGREGRREARKTKEAMKRDVNFDIRNGEKEDRVAGKGRRRWNREEYKRGTKGNCEILKEGVGKEIKEEGRRRREEKEVRWMK